MKIHLKPELSHIIAWDEVLIKRNRVIITDVNYRTILELIRIFCYDKYLNLSNLDQEKLRFAINSIISENKDLKISTIIKYILNVSTEQLESIGNTYFEIISNFLTTSNFQQKNGKGLIYLNSELIDFEFLFRNFPNLDILFIFNEETGKLILLDRNLHIIKEYKNIKEADLNDIFEEYNPKNLKQDKNKYYNDLMNKLLMDYLNTNTFLENFLDEIFFKLSNLIMMADEFEIDERNYKLLLEHYDKLAKDQKIEDALIKILSKKNFNKYKEVEKIK